MVEFGSAAWFDRLTSEAASLTIDRSPAVVIEQTVTDPGAGEIDRWHLVVGAGVTARRGPATGPTITLMCDRATAAALAEGRDNAQRAIATGRLRVGGDLGALIDVAPQIAALIGSVR